MSGMDAVLGLVLLANLVCQRNLEAYNLPRIMT